MAEGHSTAWRRPLDLGSDRQAQEEPERSSRLSSCDSHDGLGTKLAQLPKLATTASSARSTMYIELSLVERSRYWRGYDASRAAARSRARCWRSTRPCGMLSRQQTSGLDMQACWSSSVSGGISRRQ